MDLSNKILRDDVPEVTDIQAQFKNMTDHGHRETVDKLRKENEMLKNALLQV